MSMSDPMIAKQARFFEVIAWIAATVLALQMLALLGLLALIGPSAQAIANGDWSIFWAAAEPIVHRLVGLLPSLFYLGGLLAVAAIFHRVADGELFSRANSAGLAEVGSSLLWGAAASAVIVPSIRAWVEGNYGFGGLTLELETWVIAVIGGAILILGRMMSRAGAIQSELDSII